jgi:hypothetical protein
VTVLRVPATITWPGPGSPGVNVWSIRTFNFSLLISELDAALDALQTFYESIKLMYAPGTKITLGPDIMDRQSLEDASRPARDILSTGGPNTAAPSLQVCVSWRTELRARRGQGRTFLGPLAGDVVSGDGTPSGTYLTPINTAAQALIDNSVDPDAWAVGVWGLDQPAPSGIPPEEHAALPRVHRDITTFKVRDQFAVLRSRRD